jgi:hypothetical protein
MERLSFIADWVKEVPERKVEKNPCPPLRDVIKQVAVRPGIYGW